VDQAEHFGLYPNGKSCLLCGRILRDAADEHTIYTRLASGIVFLHPACAVTLGRRLFDEGLHADDDEVGRWIESSAGTKRPQP
jgi:hypothetical protein